MTSAHPTDDTLWQFSAGKLSDPETQAVHDHVKMCAQCNITLDALSEECPDQLGYKVRGLLGWGGMGVVYRVYDSNLRRELALKTVRKKFSTTDRVLSRFQEEMFITAQLQHPGVPPVHLAGNLPDGRPYYLMKVLKGEDLSKRMGRRTSVTEELLLLLGVFQKVCQPVAYAHERGLIHRDLKPSNVMVSAHGDVQVMDWGLARKIESESTEHAKLEREVKSLTTIATPRDEDGRQWTRGAIGTFAYMSPEQAAKSQGVVGARSDVFGLGAILCEILTGQPPYVAENQEAVKAMAILGALDAAFTRLEQCRADQEMVALCKRCLARDSVTRPADATAVEKEVGRLLAAAEEQVQQAKREAAVANAKAAEETKTRQEAEARAAESRKKQRWQKASFLFFVALLSAGCWAVVWKSGHDAERRTEELERQIVEAKRVAIEEQRQSDRLKAGALEARIEQRLSQPAWDQTSAETVITLIRDLKPLAPDRAEIAHARLVDRWREDLLAALDQPRLEPAVIDRVDREATLLAKENGVAAAKVLQKSKERQAGWQTVFELRSDFSNLVNGFDPGQVMVENGAIRPVVSKEDARENRPQPTRQLLTRMECQGNSKIEALFDRSWALAPEVGLMLYAPPAPRSPITALAFSPDGTTLAYGVAEGRVKVWDIKGAEIAELAINGPVMSLAYLEGSSQLVVGARERFEVWDLDRDRNMPVVTKEKVHDGFVSGLASCEHGRRLVTAGSVDGTLRLWDTSNWKEIGTLGQHTGGVRQIAITKDRTVLASSGGANGKSSVRLWNITTRSEFGKLLPHPNPAESLAFALESHQLATATPDGVIRVWDSSRGELLTTAHVGIHPGSRHALAFLHDGRLRVGNGFQVFGSGTSVSPETGAIGNSGVRLVGGTGGTAIVLSPNGELAAVDIRGRMHLESVAGTSKIALLPDGYEFILSQKYQKIQGAVEAQNPRELVAIIRRGGAILHQEIIRVGPGPLRLVAKRDDKQLTFQVNGDTPIKFLDPFPLPANAGRYGVILPHECGLMELALQQEKSPNSPSLLQEGDWAYSAKKYRDACSKYHDQQNVAHAGDMSEAQFKEAICLLELKNKAEAIRVLDKLAIAGSPEWSKLAAARLWILYLEERDPAKIDELFKIIIYAPTDLLNIIPYDIRLQMLELMKPPRGINVIFSNASTIEQYKRAIATAKLLGQHGEVQVLLHAQSRVHSILAQEDKAYIATKEALGVADPDRADDPILSGEIVSEYLWLYRLQAKLAGANEAIRRITSAVERCNVEEGYNLGRGRNFTLLLLERARAHAAKGEWPKAEQDAAAAAAFALKHQDLGQGDSTAAVFLLQGFLFLERGDENAAQESWRQGALLSGFRPDNPQGDPEPFFASLVSGHRFVYLTILRSLTGDLTDAHVDALIERAAEQFGGKGQQINTLLKSLELNADTLKRVWRSDRGRRIAKQIAFRELTFAECVFSPAKLLLLGAIQNQAFPRGMTKDQEDACWDMLGEWQQLHRDGKVTLLHLGAIRTAWTSNKFGLLTAILGGLPQMRQAEIAWLLGHRSLTMKWPDEDTKKHFRLAIECSSPASPIGKLAKIQLEKAK